MNHLTDEQLAEWLAGESGEETRAHLQSCASCNSEAIRLHDGILRYSMSVRQQASRAQSARMGGGFTHGRVFGGHRLRWAFAGVLALLLAAPTAWMMKSHTVTQSSEPTVSAPHGSQPDSQHFSQPNSKPSAQMNDDELLEAVNNDLSRDVPQALAPVGAITVERNQIAAAASAANNPTK
jgi:hypothetical protein